ncbi:unnamed protein product [Gadus morhua 'NCC']
MSETAPVTLFVSYQEHVARGRSGRFPGCSLSLPAGCCWPAGSTELLPREEMLQREPGRREPHRVPGVFPESPRWLLLAGRFH